MLRIAKRTNRTRDEQRPPRLCPTVNASILASLGFVQSKPASSKNVSKKKRGSNHPDQPVGNKPIVGQQPGASIQPEIKKRPAVEQSGAKKLPAAGEQPGASENSDLQKPPGASQVRPVAREEQKMNDQPAPKPPLAQKKNYNDTGSHAPGQNQQPPSGFKSPTHNIPMQKPQPEPPASNSSNPPEIQAQASKTNGNGVQMSSQPVNSNNAPTNGREGKIPGANGSNIHPPRSSLFRSGAFVTMPTVKIPPKAGSPAQKPPSITQIPMEMGRHPDEEPETGEVPRNETAPEPEQEPQPPAVPPTPVPSQPPIANATASTSASPTGLDLVFQQNKNLPNQAVVFGVSEDGLPVLLDLRDPAPGAVVVIGDDREAQLEFLRTAVASVAMRNSPRGVQFLVLSCEPDSWKQWIAKNGFERHCLTIESAEEGLVREWILRLADWTEQRRLGQSSGPAVLLVMDTLSFLSQLEYDVRLNFDWMAKEGPQAQIWPLAAISTNLAKALSGRRMLRGFQTRIMGYANQPADLMQLAGVDAQEAETFSRRGEFAVKVGENWLRFKLPGR